MNTIRELNDMLRMTMIVGGKVILTSGVASLDGATKWLVIDTVRNFSRFTEDNDPHGEHDFGTFEVNGERYMFKIDYYDVNYEYLSPNPADPRVTRRVLTVMCSHEY